MTSAADSEQTIVLATNEFGHVLRMLRLLRAETPWAAQQTFASLRKHTVEEVFELADAIDANDAGAVIEEVGDLLYNCCFYAAVAQPQRSMVDALRGVIGKLVRRHPNVDFDKMVVLHPLSADQEREDWEQIKRREKQLAANTRQSVLAGLAKSTPALHKSIALCNKLDSAGYKLLDAQTAPLPAAVADALAALIGALRADGNAQFVGDAIFALTHNGINVQNVNVDASLTRVNAAVEARFREVEARAGATPLTSLSREQQLELLQ
jgi:ATP diphosphatase